MAKKNTVKKNIKSKKRKFSLKNVNFKKNWKKLSYLGLAGFLAVSSVGYGLWRTASSKDASAAGWRTVRAAYPNKTYSSSGYSSIITMTPQANVAVRFCITARYTGSTIAQFALQPNGIRTDFTATNTLRTYCSKAISTQQSMGFGVSIFRGNLYVQNAFVQYYYDY